MSETFIAGGMKPQVRGAARNSFTKARQERFLAELGATCNVKRSARRAGVSDKTVYRHRRQSAAFRAGWAEALKEAYANLELAMLDRMLNGTVKTVRRAGKIVDRTHEYPNAIALTLLRLHREHAMPEAETSPEAADELRERIFRRVEKLRARIAAGEEV